MRATGATLGFVLLLTAATWAATPLGTAFMYQGRLTDGNVPATGVYDLYVLLYDAETGGVQVGATTVEDVTVTNGVFTVTLDFGVGVFTGSRRWLLIGVRPGNSTDMFTTLSPRQEVTPTPYALFATNASTAVSARGLAITGGQLRLEGSDEDASVIGGSTANSVVHGIIGGTVSGGGANSFNGTARPNSVADDYGTVAGGLGNQAGNGLATPGGGNATVGGGFVNTASGASSTVGGGYLNVASGDQATVGGGANNAASGAYATIPGGNGNTAQGDYSLAAGTGARAQHKGAFVWADSAIGVFSSNRADSFLIRTAGGMGVQGQASFGGVTPNAGYEPVEIQGTWAGLSMFDRTGGAAQRWVIYANGTGASGAQNLYFYTNNTLTTGTGTGATYKFAISANGNVTALGCVIGTNTLACSSDARLKNDVTGLRYGLSDVMRLRPVSWTWKDPALTAPTIGLIAQEVEPVIPELVLHDTDAAGSLGLNYVGFVPVMIKAVQEQQATILEQATAIDDLRARLARLESALASMTAAQHP